MRASFPYLCGGYSIAPYYNMDKKGFTIEVTSRYEEWWRYNVALMCGCFAAEERRTGFASAVRS